MPGSSGISPKTGPAATRKISPADVPADLVEKLGALGYVSGGGSPDRGSGADPKDKIGEYKVLNALLHDGLLKLRDKDYAGGAARFRELTKRGIDSFESHYYFGEALVGLGRWREAADEFERAIPRLPGFAASYLTLADCRVAMGDRSGAIAALRQGERAVPTDPRMYRRLGDLYRDGGDLQQAARSFREAMARDPGEASQWNSLGMIVGAEGNLSEAERLFREAIERDPREARLHLQPWPHAPARTPRRRSGPLLPQDAGVESGICRRERSTKGDREEVRQIANVVSRLELEPHAELQPSRIDVPRRHAERAGLIPATAQDVFCRVGVRQIEHVEEQVQIGTAEGDRLLDARVDQVQARHAPAAVERLHVNGRIARKTETADAHLPRPRPAGLVLQIAGYQEIPRKVVDHLGLRHDRAIANQQAIGVDEIVLTALTCLPRPTCPNVRTCHFAPTAGPCVLDGSRPSDFDSTSDSVPCQLLDIRLVPVMVTPLYLLNSPATFVI